jgi:broad specificity phosphatase PhoE
MDRGAPAIHTILDAHHGRDIIAVVHGGTIRAALGLALGLEPEACLAFTMENCSLTRIDHIDGPGMGHGWRVVTVNRPPR